VSDISLTATSYLVLGLVRALQPCTSYDMKRLVGVSIGHFWPFPHSQLYAEPARLARHGYLSEEQEHGGRRRRRYRLTGDGEAALHDWLAAPMGDDTTELRDLGLLKLFFGDAASEADLRAIAEARRAAHDTAIRELERIRETDAAEATPAQLATLELGLRWHRTAMEFWVGVADDPPAAGRHRPPRP
jgi:PadR family transcriptional regulator, regulatory protein AphA